jgi:hypothetical protein
VSKESPSAKAGAKSGARSGAQAKGAKNSDAKGAPAPGEPLTASWTPERRNRGKRRPDRRGGFGKAVATYGWRVYAVPILLVLTLLVGYDATKTDSADAAGSSTGAPAAAGGTPSPAITEQPAVPVDMTLPTAELPGGGNFTQRGSGTWHIIPGTGRKIGTGAKAYTYTVEVEDGIDSSSYGGDDAFAKTVEATLSDPRSWIGGDQITVQRVDASVADPSFRISLTTPDTDHRPDLCNFVIRYEASCYRQSVKRVVINLSRWVRGALAFNGDLGAYRAYAINHEVGHAFNNQHVGCQTEGALAPVMMQQTFGVSNNVVAQLNQVDPLNRAKVPADSKTCVSNAWPFPTPRH